MTHTREISVQVSGTSFLSVCHPITITSVDCERIGGLNQKKTIISTGQTMHRWVSFVANCRNSIWRYSDP